MLRTNSPQMIIPEHWVCSVVTRDLWNHLHIVSSLKHQFTMAQDEKQKQRFQNC